MTWFIEFRHDDAGYLAWLAAYPEGYVVNIARSHSATQARVHHAGCRTISGGIPRGGVWTGRYVKVCAEQLAELEQRAIDQVGEPIRRCGICHPTRGHEDGEPRHRAWGRHRRGSVRQGTVLCEIKDAE
jgi:hypothetical protein